MMANARKSRRPTLADVAQRVGVSAKTVSRVLNEDGPVSESTRVKVLAAVEELGFQPNLMARNMRMGTRDSTVGLIVPEVGNPFFGALAGGVEGAVRGHGLTLLMAASEEDEQQEHTLVTAFLARRISGLLVVPAAGSNHRYLRRERDSGLPLVFVDRPATGLSADAVVSANEEGARTGVAHLAAHGHRRIAFIGDRPATLYTRKMRQRGYESALEAAGIPYDPSLVVSAHDPYTAGVAVRRLLDSPTPPTAVFTANNVASLGVLPALAEAGRRDVALVGFDDLPLAGVLQPGLTVVAQDPAAIGRAAAEQALARLRGERGAARTVTVTVRLVERGSGELPPPKAQP
ncbi:LacI family DNA-binding transcriptional regulator [Streptomyces jeddahensis]|uniref:HTH-type transcriptional repressor CytR n=1 Tax=Streptomyces jeddahensis TaxID=1716141 RepID=A0A177HLL3_9ACTN|nr:LacI family DNA-binding transcriptional regulator [Streptomyces jeddahensis]OAH11114.1 HTH-type transcriptional repressor CytR [Streptomyces jeddahensis]